jgi:diacylglycerol O-acyltransferase / wax synthase
VMDRRHPLWDLTLVHGLRDNRTALIVRLHHCLADGIAGVGIVNVLLDATPEAPRLPKRKLKFRLPPQCDPLSSITAGCVDSYSDFVKRILSAWTDVLNVAERAAANGGNLPTNELSQLLPEITASTERLRFNVIYRGPQKFAWAGIPLAEVKAIRQKFEASVNDVILALVTATVRRYQELHGERVKGRLLRMMVPVNLRGSESTTELGGNRISLVPVTVPLDIRNPRKLLEAVHRRTEFLKHAHAAELVSLTGGLIGMFPTPLQAFAGQMLSQLPITPFNLVCTNVPGPQYPLYLLGHKMTSWYPYVPVGGEMAVNCAVLSYDGNIGFGFSGDVHAAPDLRRMEEFVKVSFAELREAAGITPPRKKSSRSRKPAVKTPKASKPASEPAKVRVSIPLTVPTPKVEVAQSPAQAENEQVLTQLIA